MRVGVHTSIAGALENAAHRAYKIGCDGFQMFSANPRGWRAGHVSAEARERFREVRAGYGLTLLAIHANYLINLAAPDPAVRALSVSAFRGELARSLALGADYLVVHAGSAKHGDRDQAIAIFVKSLLEAAKGLDLNGLTVLVENTAGQGSVLGSNFEELAAILHGVTREIPVGVCIDTAHLFAAGYGIHTAPGLRDALRRIDAILQLKTVRLFHANDSKAAFASHCDRHEHIGEGQIGAEAFGRILRHPKLRAIPFICETPLDEPDDDFRNLQMIRNLGGDRGQAGASRGCH
ncbi:MAG TPA: deoxyribonuclease IV [Terriglobia bacterium]